MFEPFSASKDDIAQFANIIYDAALAVENYEAITYAIYFSVKYEFDIPKMDEKIAIQKDRLTLASDDELLEKKSEIEVGTDWMSGSILGGDFDEEINAIDAIDEELNKREWDRYSSEKHSDESYGVRREHGWYLPNDD